MRFIREKPHWLLFLLMLLKKLFSTSSFLMSTPHRISNAAILLIGDEILNGKIKDTNSQYFAEYCFDIGVDLRRITVVPDDESDIIETLRNLQAKYDFIITTGGIGPTHDDITYESIAKAYNLPLELHQETVDKMNALAQHPPNQKDPNSAELKAQLRMATFPKGDQVVSHFVHPDLWVPVVSIEHKVYIFPGIPRLFQKMLEGLKPHIVGRVDAPKLLRKYVSTTTSESSMASILKEIQERYSSKGVKIGSYPHFNDRRNTISILGPDEKILQSIVNEVIPEVADGHEVSAEVESKSS